MLQQLVSFDLLVDWLWHIVIGVAIGANLFLMSVRYAFMSSCTCNTDVSAHLCHALVFVVVIIAFLKFYC